MYAINDNGILIVELETGIDSTAKLNHAKSQVARYLKLQNQYRTRELMVALLYAAETTPERIKIELSDFAAEHGIILRSYYIRKIMTQYNKMVNQLSYASGITLGRAVALGVTSIGWLNKFMVPYLISKNNSAMEDSNRIFENLWENKNRTILDIFDLSIDELPTKLPWIQLKQSFSSPTNFYVLKRLVEDFELIEILKIRSGTEVALTDYGCRFRDELYLRLFENLSDNVKIQDLFKDLTVGQKRILLEILLNGNFTKIKVNIFHFLRFIHLTEGTWLPKSNTKLTPAECQYLNNSFNSSYKSRTLKDLVLQTCTFCEELGLVKKLPMNDELYDKVMFTTIGSRVINHFEQLLHIERERYQIPLQVE
jgi:hypothetical protein